MAYTKEEHEAILKSIAESADMETTLDLIQSLRTDYDERLSIEQPTDEYKGKYEELKAKYIERFFTDPAKADEKKEEAKEETEEDVKKDGEELSYDDLFKEREGK